MLNIQNYTGGFTATNGYAIQSDGGCILIDAPEGMTGWLKGNEITPAALLLTHLHFDHVMDVQAIVEEFSIPVYAFTTLTRDLTLEDMLGAFTGSNFEVKPFEVNHLLEGKSTVSVSGRDFELLHVPGHSPDSLCFHLKEDGILFGGDVLFNRGIGRSDFPHSDSALLENGIRERVYKLDEATRVLPGHGPETSVGDEKAQNPFVRP